VVHEDLRHILRSWGDGGIKDEALRRDSTVLRRFLNYHDLIKVWNTVMGLGQAFLVPASGIIVRNESRLGTIDFATCSQVDQPGIKTYAVSVKTGPHDEPGPIGFAETKALKLKKFISGPCCVVGGVLIRRNDIIQFVANKLGGAHYDTGRQKPNEQAISQLGDFHVADRNAVYYEMLGIGQVLARSNSCRILLETLEERDVP